MTGLMGWVQGTELLTDQQLRSLPGEEKLRIVKAMGFTPVGSDHDPRCPYVLDAGYRCNCVPPSIKFSPPLDVQVALNDTWEDRRARAKQPRRIPEDER